MTPLPLFSPDRPKILTRPAYCTSSLRPIAPLPYLAVSPIEGEPDLLYISMWLLVRSGLGRTYFARFLLTQFPSLWAEWHDWPEGCMKTLFGYDPDEFFGKGGGLNPPPKASVSLDDLGL